MKLYILFSVCTLFCIYQVWTTLLFLWICLLVTCLTFSDGLVDCMDPDCCLQATCHTTSLCVGSPDPLDIIQETQMSSAQSNLQTFYDRVSFLVGRDSTHTIPGANPFDGKWVTMYSQRITPKLKRLFFLIHRAICLIHHIHFCCISRVLQIPATTAAHVYLVPR